jgi:hypothetical protein
MSKQTTIELWEQALAAMLELPPSARDLGLPRSLSVLGPRIDEARCRMAVERVRAAVFESEVEDVLQNTAKGLLGWLEIARVLLAFEGTRH